MPLFFECIFFVEFAAKLDYIVLISLLIEMLGFTYVMALACYNPDASFAYNPVTRQGYLKATFIMSEDTDDYYLCQKLSDHLVRAEIKLASSF